MKPIKILNLSNIDITKFVNELTKNSNAIEVFYSVAIVYSIVNTKVINALLELTKEEKLPEFDIIKWTDKLDLKKCVSLYSYIIKLNNVSKEMTEIANKNNTLGNIGFFILEQNIKLIEMFSKSFLMVMTDYENINEAKNILNDTIRDLSYNESMATVLNNVILETDVLVKNILSIALNHINNKPIVKDDIILIDVDPKQTEIIIALNELGILDFLRDKHPHLKMSANGFANIIHLITGKQTESLVSNINAMYSPKQKASKNNPYTSDNVVNKVKTRLNEQLSLI